MAAHLDEQGQYRVQIERNYRLVELTLTLQSSATDIYPHRDLSVAKHKTQGLSRVVATEVACVDVERQTDCFDPQQALSWVLLTTMPVDTNAALQRVIRFYALRWRIERLHFTLKSGALAVEQLQSDDVHTLTNALAFYSVVAWQLLALTYALRLDPTQPAEAMFEPAEVTLLKQVLRNSIRSVKDAALALANLVGFAPSKKQPLPGVKVLATAIERFFFIKLGAAASVRPLQD